MSTTTMAIKEASISYYKNIEQVKLELNKVNVIVGPPASGKSNLVEALAIAGFLRKISFLELYDSRELRVDISQAAENFRDREVSLNELLRLGENSGTLCYFGSCKPEKPGEISLNVNGNILRLRLLAGEARRGAYPSNAVRILIYTDKGSSEVYEEVLGEKPSSEELLKFHGKLKETQLPMVRLYSYDRFISGAEKDKFSHSSDLPKTLVLSENGDNLPRSLYGVAPLTRILDRLHEWLSELGMNLEVVAASDRVSFSVNRLEIPVESVARGVLRLLYYMLALESNAIAKKSGDPMAADMLILEEPMSEIYPYARDVLVESFENAIKSGIQLVIVTHNPLLVSRLLDVTGRDEFTLYYLYTVEGRAKAVKLDLVKVFERYYAIEDLLLQAPKVMLEEMGLGG